MRHRHSGSKFEPPSLRAVGEELGRGGLSGLRGKSYGRRRKSSQKPTFGPPPSRALREAGRGRECRRDPRGRPSKFEGGRGGVRPRRAERSARQIVRETPTKKKKNCIVALAHHKARTAYLMNLAALRFQLGRMSPLMILI